METPTPLLEVNQVYLIDRLKGGSLWYLWTIENGEWEVLKTGDWKSIIQKLLERRKSDEQAETSTGAEGAA